MTANIKFVNNLVNNLDMFDGAGYDAMGTYAQIFLNAAASDDKDALNSVVASHAEDLSNMYESVTWIREDAREKAWKYIELVSAWPTAGSAQNRIEAKIAKLMG